MTNSTTPEPTPQTQWTPERRESASRRARLARPWLYSTGPRTASGKRTSSRNSYKHGHYSFEKTVLGWYVRLCALRLKQVKAMKIKEIWDKTPTPRGIKKFRNELIEMAWSQRDRYPEFATIPPPYDLKSRNLWANPKKPPRKPRKKYEDVIGNLLHSMGQSG